MDPFEAKVQSSDAEELPEHGSMYKPSDWESLDMPPPPQSRNGRIQGSNQLFEYNNTFMGTWPPAISSEVESHRDPNSFPSITSSSESSGPSWDSSYYDADLNGLPVQDIDPGAFAYQGAQFSESIVFPEPIESFLGPSAPSSSTSNGLLDPRRAPGDCHSYRSPFQPHGPESSVQPSPPAYPDTNSNEKSKGPAEHLSIRLIASPIHEQALSRNSKHSMCSAPDTSAKRRRESQGQGSEGTDTSFKSSPGTTNGDSVFSPPGGQSFIDSSQTTLTPSILGGENRPNSELVGMDALDPVLNASEYYDKLDMLELRIAEICGMSQGPLMFTGSGLGDIQKIFDMFNQVFVHLKSEGFCRENMSIAVEGSLGIARIIHLSPDDFNWSLPSPRSGSSVNILDIFRGSLGQYIRDLKIGDISAELLKIILATGLVSFSGSHVCRFDSNLWGQEIDNIPIGDKLSFRPRELACLREFIGGPIWVLGKARDHVEEERLKISLTVQDFQDLWGPGWFVGHTSEEGKFIRTERGFVVPLPRHQQHNLPEIECHWTPSLDGLFDIDSDDPILLSAASTILIGTDTYNPPGLVYNSRCNNSVQRFQQHVVNNHSLPGIREESYQIEDRQFQIGMSIPHGPALNMTLVHKRHPMRSMKETIITSYANTSIDERKFLGVLKLQIGLEISACTGNAQRITLWDALRLANTEAGTPGCVNCKHNIGDINCMQSCWTRLSRSRSSSNAMTELESRQTLVDAISALQHTGINQEGNLEAHWPFVDVPLNHHITSSKSNRWFNIIRDTTRAATFAVISQRCLEFHSSGLDGICSKLAVPNTIFQSKQTFLSIQVLPQMEARSRFGFLRSQQNNRLKLPTCSLDNVSLVGGLFRVWKISMLLVREFQGNERPAIANTSTNPWSLVSSRAAPDFQEVITPELGFEKAVPVVICSSDAAAQAL